MTDLFEDNGALFSEDRQHRYRLWRIWDKSKPLVMFIGLNPSTANEAKNDPTIRYVVDFCKRWDYGGVYMMNLFSVISSDPKVLLTCADPLRDNDHHLTEIAEKCKDVVFAWGNFKQATDRREVIAARFPYALCITLRNGLPAHPLWAGMWAPKHLKEQFYKGPVKFSPENNF